MTEPTKPADQQFVDGAASSAPSMPQAAPHAGQDAAAATPQVGDKLPTPTWTMVLSEQPDAMPVATVPQANLQASEKEQPLEFAEVGDHPIAGHLEMAPVRAEKEPGGLFDAPQITTLEIKHEVVLNHGRTLVGLRFTGWGRLIAEATIGQQRFRYTSIYFSTGSHDLDLIAPVGADFTVRIRNLFGVAEQGMQILPTTALMPVVPAVPRVIHAQMPRLMLPVYAVRTLQQQIPASFRVVPRERTKLSDFSVPLQAAMQAEMKKTAALPAVLGRSQHYRRDLMRAQYRNVQGPDMNVALVQDKLKAWIAQVHHGSDPAGMP